MGISDRAVRNIISKLKKKKILDVDVRFGFSNRYWFGKIKTLIKKIDATKVKTKIRNKDHVVYAVNHKEQVNDSSVLVNEHKTGGSRGKPQVVHAVNTTKTPLEIHKKTR